MSALNKDLELWPALRHDAEHVIHREPFLTGYLSQRILVANSFMESLVRILAWRLQTPDMVFADLFKLFYHVIAIDTGIKDAAEKDLAAIVERDPAAVTALVPLLYFKGYHALQIHRIAHGLYTAGKTHTALMLQSLSSQAFAVDIHPAVKIGHGVMIDHGTGLVIGETSSIGNDVSIMQNVTLGGTGKEHGDRHPKIADGVLIGAGTNILGNITIGTCARVAAGSVVLAPVEAHVTVAGVPARVVGKAGADKPGLAMDQILPADCIVI